MDTATKTEGRATPWYKSRLLGQKPPLKLKEIWAIRIRLQLLEPTGSSGSWQGQDCTPIDWSTSSIIPPDARI